MKAPATDPRPLSASLAAVLLLALGACSDSGDSQQATDPAPELEPAESGEAATPAQGDADADGFVELFNGENLDGWTPSGENPESFWVEDGIMIVKGGRCHLFYTGEVNGGVFRDFELKARIKTFPEANSGVYFHTEFQEEGWPSVGHEAQVNATHRDPRKTGSLYAVSDYLVLAEGQNPPPQGEHTIHDAPPHADGEWFDYYVKVEGNRVVIKVDGVTTVDYLEPEGGSDPENRPGRKLSEGTFAIQAHDPDSEIHFSRIAVRPL